MKVDTSVFTPAFIDFLKSSETLTETKIGEIMGRSVLILKNGRIDIEEIGWTNFIARIIACFCKCGRVYFLNILDTMTHNGSNLPNGLQKLSGLLEKKALHFSERHAELDPASRQKLSQIIALFKRSTLDTVKEALENVVEGPINAIEKIYNYVKVPITHETVALFTYFTEIKAQMKEIMKMPKDVLINLTKSAYLSLVKDKSIIQAFIERLSYDDFVKHERMDFLKHTIKTVQQENACEHVEEMLTNALFDPFEELENLKKMISKSLTLALEEGKKKLSFLLNYKTSLTKTLDISSAYYSKMQTAALAAAVATVQCSVSEEVKKPSGLLTDVLTLWYGEAALIRESMKKLSVGEIKEFIKDDASFVAKAGICAVKEFYAVVGKEVLQIKDKIGKSIYDHALQQYKKGHELLEYLKEKMA